MIGSLKVAGKTMITDTKEEIISDKFINSLCARLKENERVRRKLPVWGRVHIDRQLPFLCVYRKPSNRLDNGTEKLLFGEASYIIASDNPKQHNSLSTLIRRIAETLQSVFGSFLVIEIWCTKDFSNSASDSNYQNNLSFTIHSSVESKKKAVVDKLEATLKQIKFQKQPADVEVRQVKIVNPEGMKPLIKPGVLKDVSYIGLEINPVFRNKKTNEIFPMALRSLHGSLSRVLKRTYFAFSKPSTSHKAPHFLSLGRRTVVKSVWDVDNKLAEVSNMFSLLMTITPTNVDSAYAKFKRSKFEIVPEFTYHPIQVDISFLKRKLHNIPLERVEDPVLDHIFREQQDDIDRRLTLLADRNTPQFKYGSMQIFGGAKNLIYNKSLKLLNTLSPRGRTDTKLGYYTAQEFLKFAEDEIKYYQNEYSGFTAAAEISENVSGLIVSKGKLLIGKNVRIPKARVQALLQHEIGTHLLTYYNGKAQPFKQLYVGLAKYDELQEGIAVLSEYLVGGLSSARIRLLAARVIAVRRLIEGASFIETFRELNSIFKIEKRTAFMITMRVFRGGGLTKDATYLKGLMRLIKHLGNGGNFETLFIGKFNTDDIPFIDELKYRNILLPAPLLPRYYNEPFYQEKLEKLKQNINLFELITPDRKRRLKK